MNPRLSQFVCWARVASKPHSKLVRSYPRFHSNCGSSHKTQSVDAFTQASTISSQKLPQDGLSLKDFMTTYTPEKEDTDGVVVPPHISHMESTPQPFGTSPTAPQITKSKTYYMETYGCQMNVADSELVHAILRKAGLTQVSIMEDADVILINTCAIREGAEQRIWGRLNEFKRVVRKNSKIGAKKIATVSIPEVHGVPIDGDRIAPRRILTGAPIVGVLGCMAERLKSKLLETDKVVDLVAGPDAYRDLPRLIGLVEGGNMSMNTQLSLDETYADIVPVRVESNNISAFVSITRGCDNMCSYCIVPYTRGRERSRKATSIIEEVQQLAAQGFKEITLLGQNVNSYNDTSVIKEEEERLSYLDSLSAEQTTPEEAIELELLKQKSDKPRLSPSGRVALQDDFQAGAGKGFKNISRRSVHGVTFADLLEQVSDAVPGVRIRFTSPHPKDFSPMLVDMISKRPNICKQLHMPAQSGSTSMLSRMRRGYSRESYFELVKIIREKIPQVALSTDIITGFCDETEAEHQDTVSLMREVQYDHSFMFKYSQREKTHAHRVYEDNVNEDVKSRRLDEIIRMDLLVHSLKLPKEVGRIHLVLADGFSKRSESDLTGRTDTNIPVNFPLQDLPYMDSNALQQYDGLSAENFVAKLAASNLEVQTPELGDFIAVIITESRKNSLRATPLFRTSLEDYHSIQSPWNTLGSVCVDISDKMVQDFAEALEV